MEPKYTEELKVSCPTCKEKTNWKNNLYRPFCSRRCSTIDLGNWANEKYKVSGQSEENSIHSADDDFISS